MPCKIKIREEITSTIMDKSKEANYASPETIKSVENKINQMFGEKVVNLAKEGDIVKPLITISDGLVQKYYDHELEIEEKEDAQRREEGNWTVNEEGDIVPMEKEVVAPENVIEEQTEDQSQVEEELKEAKTKLAEFNKSLKIEPKDLRASKEDAKKKLQDVKNKFLENGFTQVSENKFELKTPSYITAKAKQEALDGENAFKEVRKDGENYIISYNLADTSAKTRQDLQKQGELPFTESDLKDALNEQSFLDDLSDNIFDGLTEEQKQIIKNNLENGDYEINCKI